MVDWLHAIQKSVDFAGCDFSTPKMEVALIEGGQRNNYLVANRGQQMVNEFLDFLPFFFHFAGQILHI